MNTKKHKPMTGICVVGAAVEELLAVVCVGCSVVTVLMGDGVVLGVRVTLGKTDVKLVVAVVSIECPDKKKIQKME